MHVHDRIPVIGSHLEQQVISSYSRIVDQDSGRGEFLSDASYGLFNSKFVRHVDTDGERFASRRSDLFYNVGALRLVEIKDSNGKPVTTEALSDCSANTPSSPRHYGRTLLSSHVFSSN
jgi:hypothetical protein